MVIVLIAAPLWAAAVNPFSKDSTSKLPFKLEFRGGVNFTPACASAKVM
jgi:hypothetical protein